MHEKKSLIYIYLDILKNSYVILTDDNCLYVSIFWKIRKQMGTFPAILISLKKITSVWTLIMNPHKRGKLTIYVRVYL